METERQQALLLSLHSILRQGERTVDRALSAEWASVRAFYTPERLEWIRRHLMELVGIYDLGKSMPARWTRQIWSRVDGPWPFRVAMVALGTNLTRTEAIEVKDAIDRLLSLLEFTDKPSQKNLIALRMRLFRVAYAVEGILEPSEALTMSIHVEHYDSPAWMPHYSPTEIMSKYWATGGRRSVPR